MMLSSLTPDHRETPTPGPHRNDVPLIRFPQTQNGSNAAMYSWPMGGAVMQVVDTEMPIWHLVIYPLSGTVYRLTYSCSQKRPHG